MNAGTPTFASPQWRAANEHSHYPFTDSSELQLTDGNRISHTLLVDARFYIPGLIGPVSLLSIEVTGTRLALTIGQYTNAETVAIATIDISDPRKEVPCFLAGGEIAGTLVAGESNWTELLALDRGVYQLSPGSAEFVPAVTVNVPVNTNWLLGPAGEVLGNVVRLVGENGVRLECDDESRVIHVHAVGEPLYRIAECGIDVAAASQVIERVVFQSRDVTVECFPDQNGRIFILPATYDKADAALRLQSQENGIQFQLVGKSVEAR